MDGCRFQGAEFDDPSLRRTRRRCCRRLRRWNSIFVASISFNFIGPNTGFRVLSAVSLLGASWALEWVAWNNAPRTNPLSH
jgi:hypothetical protein